MQTLVLLTNFLLKSYIGDHEGWGIHLDGLEQIIRLRGGLDSLRTFQDKPIMVSTAMMTWRLRSNFPKV